MQRFELEQNKPTHEVVPYPYTISGQKTLLLDWLAQVPRISFVKIMENESSKIAVIFNFLAILELLQLREINLQLGEGFNNFWIEKTQQDSEVLNNT